jgi:hypothetical protein
MKKRCYKPLRSATRDRRIAAATANRTAPASTVAATLKIPHRAAIAAATAAINNYGSCLPGTFGLLYCCLVSLLFIFLYVIYVVFMFSTLMQECELIRYTNSFGCFGSIKVLTCLYFRGVDIFQYLFPPYVNKFPVTRCVVMCSIQ